MNTELDQGKFLSFDQGEIYIEALEFDGNREAGEDIYFISKFENRLEADLDSGVANQKVTYDLPQGIYKRIKLRIGNADLSKGPGLTYSGTYQSLKEGDLPVVIDFSNVDPIEIIAEDRASGKGGVIIINKQNPAKAELHFDPFFLFQVSNSRQLESADISLVEGTKMIIISSDSNTVIFNIILNRLERSVSTIFN